VPFLELGRGGKSIIELKHWFSPLPERGPVIYLGAEDDKDEIHMRLSAITRHYGVTFKQLADGGLQRALLVSQWHKRQGRGDRPLSPALPGRGRHQT
jgi:hypothetical protein